jgi:hypothetical protein
LLIKAKETLRRLAMFIYKTLSTVVCAGLLVVALGGCKSEGPMERAGRKMDEATESLSDAVRKKGPAERAGEKIDKAAEDTKEAAREATR